MYRFNRFKRFLVFTFLIIKGLNNKFFLNCVVKIQNILKLWKLRNLTIEETIVVFKLSAISKLTPSGLQKRLQMTIIDYA